MKTQEHPLSSERWFSNPFQIEDLLVFDEEALYIYLTQQHVEITPKLLAQSTQYASQELVERMLHCLTAEQQKDFRQHRQTVLTNKEREQAQRELLDTFFWELIYWKMPERYEELTEGELLHPAIFRSLAPIVQGQTVLDAGAGSGRTTFASVDTQAERVYAVEPSPGLLTLLRDKIKQRGIQNKVVTQRGYFAALPLSDASVDHALSCSAFTAHDKQGGEIGLAELKRVTRPGGRIIILWPRTCDHNWFYEHGFQYASFPGGEQMRVHFRSTEVALRSADLFYGNKIEVKEYLQREQTSELPFTVIGLNPPADYFWLQV